MSVRKISPLLDAMELGECFSQHEGVSCYVLTHPESGREFVLKHISIPASAEQVQALLLTGAYASEAEAAEYYRKEAEALVKEAEDRKKLLDCPYILPFLGVQMEPKEEGVGYEVYAVLPKRNSLKDYLEQNAISHLRGINMGIDLCVALSALREEGFVHGNLKPGNVYFSDTGRFLLGDFGLISTDDMQYAVLPEQYRSSYTAPELRNFIGGLNTTVDIYSLGMILYRIYNGNHAPFEDEQTNAKAADTRRLEGEALPAPLYADYELAEIIQKACAHKPEDRYQTPDEMRVALEQYMRRNAVSDHLIVPPLVADDGPLDAADREEEIEPVRANDVEQLDDQFKVAFAPDSKRSRKKKKKAEATAETQPALVDDTPMLTAERRRAAEKAAKRRRRKRRAWGFFAAAMILLVVLVGLYEFTEFGQGLWHYFVKVESLTVSDVTADSLQVHLKASVEQEQFEAVCEDSYGNSTRVPFENGTASLTGLTPGTQYTVRAVLPGRHKVSGQTSVIASTIPQTEILTFTATDGAEPGAVQLDLVLRDGGTEPAAWTLRYGPTGGEETETEFSGHSTQISGLETGTEYTFRLIGSENLYLIGQTTASYTPILEIHAENLALAEILDGTARVRWTCTSELPESWILTCTDAEGNALQVTVDPAQPGENGYECSASIPGIEPGKPYSLMLTADGLYQPLTLEIEDAVIQIDSFTAEPTYEGVRLTWTANREPEAGWMISGTYGDNLQLAESAQGGEALIAVLPDATYEFTLKAADGSSVTGHTTVSVQTLPARRFAELGVTESGTTIGTYDAPQTENYTVADVKRTGGTVRYAQGETILFVIETPGIPTDSDEQVTVHYVVRDANDQIVHVDREHLVWNEMWQDSAWMGRIPWLPETAGAYSFTIYINSQRVGTISFSMQ